ncbi:BZ3500_MvSof-1268-A1-R1_Chr1-3g02192 [Microbotryum saponariae]|uniref:BZ3500_MvSof-1268-A1-R1_Chr1-3g02192 protein n=1 Tax=Microbotryum saponariae TaxID=289078 RepID=A0A2X0KCU9_9BASI|nr:BZ3500_MvSof-1268-A1-R1_Chr1-3g02192 [Microbotryum saponariae]SCZ95614.1 BZ3501_MvSof-1269-A2-R1_Chr1-3g01795 [Microbotryum saponariae]SDA07495.1 BZ3501_MvSof-1269-A2-R1_Chr6-2g08597 [Microbotryum saponariae]
MPPIAGFSGESQSSDVATYTGCFRSGQRGGGYASVFRRRNSGQRLARGKPGGLALYRNTRRRMIRKKRTQNRLFGWQ